VRSVPVLKPVAKLDFRPSAGPSRFQAAPAGLENPLQDNLPARYSEVQIAQVFVELVLALQQIVQAGLLRAGWRRRSPARRCKPAAPASTARHHFALQGCHRSKPPSMPVSRRIFSRRARSGRVLIRRSGMASLRSCPLTNLPTPHQHECAQPAPPQTQRGSNPGHQVETMGSGRGQHGCSVLGGERRQNLLSAASSGRWLRSVRCPPARLSGQPTWLHSPSICAQPQVHISLCPRSLNRVLARPHPARSRQRRPRPASTALIQKVKGVERLTDGLPSARRLIGRDAPRACAKQAVAGLKLGTSATSVPKTSTASPAQIPPPAGFRNA